MPFPEKKRIIYKQNPLDQVICQLRFPPILKIETEIPANFQDAIRHQFPKFIEKSEWKMNIPEAISEQVPPDFLQQMMPAATGKNYEFSSDDDIWKINLTRNFVALTANEYRRWEAFKDKLAIPFEAIGRVYSPSYFSRVGLRYIDIIDRSRLGLKNTPWRELFNPAISGILGSDEIGDEVKSFESVYEIALDGNYGNYSMVRIATKFVNNKETGETCYMIDSDFSNTSKIPIAEALNILNFFHLNASRLIQWSIKKPLHDAMQPEDL
jgi:uncharacterized protein (TIGR04255 family)